MKNQTLPPIHREHFEQWLSIQPEDRVWNYCDINQCVWCSFMGEFHGIKVTTDTIFFKIVESGEGFRLPDWFYSIDEIAENAPGLYAWIRMPALRAFFNLPKQEPSPFTMEPQPA